MMCQHSAKMRQPSIIILLIVLSPPLLVWIGAYAFKGTGPTGTDYFTIGCHVFIGCGAELCNSSYFLLGRRAAQAVPICVCC